MSKRIIIERDTPNGPRVEYSKDNAAHAVILVAARAGFAVDFSNQIQLSSGRYRAPLVRLMSTKVVPKRKAVRK